VKYFKIKKPFSKMPKGLELSGSPGRSIGRTFTIVFKLPNPLDYVRSGGTSGSSS
jgi:hypothetical protein